MTPQQAAKYQWNIFDVTKVWPHRDFPLMPIGKLVLNRNPDNYFQETEQSAFSPSHLVPGIEPSADKMLQGRLFSYPDTHRHRLGANYPQIPVNRPRACPVMHQQRDGPMCVDGNHGSAANYEPRSTEDGKAVCKRMPPKTPAAAEDAKRDARGLQPNRYVVPLTADDFVQAGNLYRLQPAAGKQRLISNVVGHLSHAKPHIRKRQLQHFSAADKSLGIALEKVLNDDDW